MKTTSKTSPRKDKNSAAWLMWGMVCMYYLYQFFIRIAPTVIDVELMKYFSLTATSFGTLCGYYYFTYTPLQIPVGILLDKYGPKKISALGCILCGLGILMFVAVPEYSVAVLGRALMGIASAAAFIAAMKIGMNWFDKSYMALINTLTVTVGTLGACAGAPLFACLKESFDWRTLLIISSGIGVVLGIVIYIFVRDYPRGSEPSTKVNENKPSLLDGLKAVVKSRQCWVSSIYIMLVYAPLSGFADMWGVPFLKRVYDLDTVAASSASNMMYVGIVIGGPLFAWFSSFMQKRKICLWMGNVIALISFGIVILLPSINYSILTILMFLAGFGLSGTFLIYTLATEVMPNAFGGTIVAFINTFSMISGVILQPLIGWMLSKLWDGTMSDGVPFYSIACYKEAISIIVISLLVSLIFIALLKESFPEQLKKKKG